MWIQSMDREDPLEEGRATHPSILAWKIPWTEQPGSHRAGHELSDLTHTLEIMCY